MSRSFSSQFKEDFWGQLTEKELRFRMPEGASNLQCRLWIEKKWDRRKWQSYPVIEIIKDDIGRLLYCDWIWEKWECPSGGWCKQLSYDDVTVKKNSQ